MKRCLLSGMLIKMRVVQALSHPGIDSRPADYRGNDDLGTPGSRCVPVRRSGPSGDAGLRPGGSIRLSTATRPGGPSRCRRTSARWCRQARPAVGEGPTRRDAPPRFSGPLDSDFLEAQILAPPRPTIAPVTRRASTTRREGKRSE